ncbi:hypothetical protein [Undibacter mobilis]|uniref:Uncharacterized protein n=1 Tax=Undibacter mobilis TaxID=2292256 RepID=A0A371BDD0_9BRAD|nr:hypothetical protein [Undibacter mobilis]RDV05403.1 hypothetical protein DXH78_12975 [Undibacter mobilis]
MKLPILTLAAAMTFGLILAGGPARADSDDAKWVAQCVKDNKDEGQTVEVITSYCTCMNNKMSSNETRSITQWEKANKREMEACSTQAGWKGR